MRRVIVTLVATFMLLNALPALAEKQTPLPKTFVFANVGYQLNFPADWSAVTRGDLLEYLESDEAYLTIAFFTPPQVERLPIPTHDLPEAIEAVSASIGMTEFDAESAHLLNVDEHEVLNYAFTTSSGRSGQLVALCVEDGTLAIGLLYPRAGESSVTGDLLPLTARILASLTPSP